MQSTATEMVSDIKRMVSDDNDDMVSKTKMQASSQSAKRTEKGKFVCQNESSSFFNKKEKSYGV